MQAAARKNKTRKVVATALAAAMVATVAPAAALSAAGTGENAGIEAAYAATTADKLSAAAASSASQTPYAAALAKVKVAGWDGSSKVKVLDEKTDFNKNPDGEASGNPNDVYSDGTDRDGNFSPDSGKPIAEMVKGCSGVMANGVRWAYTGGKAKNDGDGWGDYPYKECGTLYIDCDGVYDPLGWSENINHPVAVSVSADYGAVDWSEEAANVIIGKHVTELAYRSMEDAQWGSDQVLTFEEPSSLTKVASKAFINSAFKKITFPASLKTVEKDAIWGGATGVWGDISYKDPANTVVDPGAIVYPDKYGSKSAKKVGKVKKLTAGKKRLTVSMKRVTGGKAYRVYYRQAGTTKYKSKLVKKLTSKNSTKSTVTYTIKGLKKGKKYQVHYIAYKKTSAKSASAITRTPDKTSPKVK